MNQQEVVEYLTRTPEGQALLQMVQQLSGGLMSQGTQPMPFQSGGGSTVPTEEEKRADCAALVGYPWPTRQNSPDLNQTELKTAQNQFTQDCEKLKAENAAPLPVMQYGVTDEAYDYWTQPKGQMTITVSTKAQVPEKAKAIIREIQLGLLELPNPNATRIEMFSYIHYTGGGDVWDPAPNETLMFEILVKLEGVLIKDQSMLVDMKQERNAYRGAAPKDLMNIHANNLAA